MGTTGFSASFSSTFSSVFSFNMHPILGGVLAGLGFWPKAERIPPASAKAKAATPAANLPDSLEPPAAPDEQAAQKKRVVETTTQQAQPVVQSLRVVRLVEAGVPAANAAQMAGRMVISGRMSDVCAELDRLAA